MSGLCIQIQPARAPGLDLAVVRDLCDLLASNEPLVKRFTLVEGDDDGPYLNLMFETNRLQALWAVLQRHLYQDSAVGELIRRASIAACEGDQGWENYLLLHHFDRTLQLDDLAGG